MPLSRLRPGALRVLGVIAVLVLPLLTGSLVASAQARPQRGLSIIAPAHHAVSGRVRFALAGVGPAIREVVFKIDGHRVWTTRHRPFRFKRYGVIDTRRLQNGLHTLRVDAIFSNGWRRILRRRVMVENRPLAHTVSRQIPAMSAPVAPSLFQAPPGNLAGAGVADFNRVTYAYSSSLTLSAESQRYQVIVLQASNASLVAGLHAANPSLKILMYDHPWFARPGDSQTLTVCTPYTSDLANHPTWFLHNQYGQPIAENTYSNQNYLMDLGNPAYQQACAARTAQLAKQYGFDGVFFDGIAASLKWDVPAGTTVPEYPTDTAWQAASSSFANYAVQALHSSGLFAFGNLCGTTITAGLWQQWASIFDGSMEESWTDAGQGLAQQVWAWPQKLADVAWSEAHGKYTILHSYNGTQAGNTYGLASMMLVGAGRTSYATSNTNYTNNEAWYSAYTTAQSLGAPAGAYTRLSNGVYERTFSNGIVLVNPTSQSKARFSLGTGLYSGSGLTNVRSVAMGATSGLILQRVG